MESEQMKQRDAFAEFGAKWGWIISIAFAVLFFMLENFGEREWTMVVFYGASFIIPAVSIWFVRAFSQIPELKTSLADFLFYPTSICWIIYGQLFNFYNLSLRASPAYVVPLPGKLLWASSTFICSLLFVKALVANRRHS